MVAIVASEPSTAHAGTTTATTTTSSSSSSNVFSNLTLVQPTKANASPALVSPAVVTPRDDIHAEAALEQKLAQSRYLPLAVANAALVSAAATVPQPQVVVPSPPPPPPSGGERQSAKISPPASPRPKPSVLPSSTGMRLNKFVRRLHDMLQSEQNSGIVEWRRGLLVLHSTDAFAKTILPKYFNTRNFKTFRRQLNYYGFVHVRSFSTTGSTTTALWVNRDLAKNGNANISSVLLLKRVEPCESAKTAEGRRVRKELAVSTVEEEIGVSAKSLQLDQIRTMALRRDSTTSCIDEQQQQHRAPPPIPMVVHCHSATGETKSATYAPLLPAPTPSSSSSSNESSDATMMLSDDDENKSAANLLLLLSKG